MYFASSLRCADLLQVGITFVSSPHVGSLSERSPDSMADARQFLRAICSIFLAFQVFCLHRPRGVPRRGTRKLILALVSSAGRLRPRDARQVLKVRNMILSGCQSLGRVTCGSCSRTLCRTLSQPLIVQASLGMPDRFCRKRRSRSRTRIPRLLRLGNDDRRGPELLANYPHTLFFRGPRSL